MKKWRKYAFFLPVYALVFSLFLLGSIFGSRTVTVLSENAPLENRRCIVIDPGHGGEDGGAVSITGANESAINLEISLRLQDLFHLLGYDTKMIRTTDRSIYTQGNTIASKKASDLKERVRIINATENALLLSIHQNHFSESKYSGAQVFYAQTQGSKDLAEQLQAALVQTVNPGSGRSCKQSTGVYLMEHISCPGILVECGFLSNPEEEAKLRTSEYQKKLCCVIAASVSQFLDP